MLTVWGRPSAYNVQKVRWFLDELGVEYSHVSIGGARGGLDSDEFLAKNPHGRIPVIEDDGYVIWESNTILRYLASTYGPSAYWSELALERTAFECWMDWELSALQPSFLGLFWAHYRTPKDQRDPQKIEHYRQRCEHHVKALDSHLSNNKHVSGKIFGLADICVGTCFFRYLNMGIKINEPKNVKEWYARLSERQSYKKIIQVPFDKLKGRLTF